MNELSWENESFKSLGSQSKNQTRNTVRVTHLEIGEYITLFDIFVVDRMTVITEMFQKVLTL